MKRATETKQVPLRWMMLGVLAAILVMLAACGDSGARPAPATAAAAAVSAESAPAPVAPSPAKEERIISGPVVVENQVDVVAQREGIVTDLLVDVGTRVRRGQVLARLDGRQLQAERDAAESRALSIEADLKNWEAALRVIETDRQRAEKMWDANLITREQLDHARYKEEGARWELERERRSHANALATLRALELELEKTRIVAPFDGVVARRYVRVGERVESSARIFWVTATQPLRMVFTLPEADVGRFQRGDKVEIFSAADPEKKRQATIVLVSPVVDPSSGTIELTAELDGPADEWRPGMTASLRLTP